MILGNLILSPLLVYGYALVLGLMFGSFLNVVIYRLPLILKRQWTLDCLEFLKEQNIKVSAELQEAPRFNLAWPNSHCPQCKHPLSIFENIPVLSYLFLRGRCRHCHSGISIRYPVVELLTALMTVTTIYSLGLNWAAVFAIVLTYGLMTLAFIDFDHQILPDQITLPFLWLGLIVNTQGWFATPTNALLGAVFGYLSLWVVYQAFKLFTKREGMGFGDFKLLALLGAWVGWKMLPVIIILSALLGSVVGISLILFKNHQRSVPIPFGPYLALAGWIALLWGDMIWGYYLQLLGLPPSP